MSRAWSVLRILRVLVPLLVVVGLLGLTPTSAWAGKKGRNGQGGHGTQTGQSTQSDQSSQDAQADQSDQSDQTGKTGKKSSEFRIQKTGIEAFDSVFSQVADIHGQLDVADQTLKDGKKALTGALGLGRGFSFADAMSELKNRAEGKVKLAMKGTTPTLELTDAVPSDVQNAVTAVNKAITDYQASVVALAALPEESKALTEQVKDFPKTFRKEYAHFKLSLSNIKKTWTKAKKIKSNIDVTAKTPDRAAQVVDRLNENVAVVTSTFSDTGSALPATPSSGAAGKHRRKK
jgi:hypothetical protein